MTPERGEIDFTFVPQQLSALCSLPPQQGVSPRLQHNNVAKIRSCENQVSKLDRQLVTHSLPAIAKKLDLLISCNFLQITILASDVTIFPEPYQDLHSSPEL